MPTTHPPRPAALRLLLLAWLIDDAPMPPLLRAWLTEQLNDRAWQPSPEEVRTLAAPFLAWAQQYPGLPDTVTLALQGVTV